MPNPIHLDRIFQGLDNRLLPDDIFEDLGPKLSGYDLVFAQYLLINGNGQVRGILRHIGLPNTVASFRTWRVFQAPIAQPP